MNPTPIYTEALREAKRRTRKGSPERAALVEMDEATAPGDLDAATALLAPGGGLGEELSR